MRYFSTLFALRTLNGLLLLWLVYKLPTLCDQIWHWHQYFAYKLTSKKMAQNFGDHPFLPAPVSSLRLEAIRINELFARPAQKCAEKRTIGTPKRDAFFMCFDAKMAPEGKDEGRIGDALLISGHFHANPDKKGLFESDLNVTRWTIVMPEENDRFVEELKKKSETVRWFRVTPDSDDKFQFARDKITRAIANRTFDVAKLDLYGQGLESCGTRQRIEQIEWIIKRLSARQLLLMVRPGTDQESAKDDYGRMGILLLWYRFVYKLYFRWNFAIFGVHSNGHCGQALQKFDIHRCEWRISLAHFADFWQATDLPAQGIGSPMEEKLRFMQFVLLPTKNCQNTYSEFSPDFSRICPNNGPKFDLAIYFRYRPIDRSGQTNLAKMVDFADKLLLFNPPQNSSVFSFMGVKLKENCISPSNTVFPMPISRVGNSTQFCAAKPLAHLLAEIPLKSDHRNLLALDLDGAEWDILGTVTSQQICKKFTQIALRIRSDFMTGFLALNLK